VYNFEKNFPFADSTQNEIAQILIVAKQKFTYADKKWKEAANLLRIHGMHKNSNILANSKLNKNTFGGNQELRWVLLAKPV
jgi:hypothetical protein